MLLLGDEGPAIAEIDRASGAEGLGLHASDRGRSTRARSRSAQTTWTGSSSRQRYTASTCRPGISRRRRLCARRARRLVVHCGSGVRRLAPLLVGRRRGALEGVSGPPQGDTTLAEARALTGDSVVLWGGIPQDLLLESTHRCGLRGGSHRRCSRGQSRRQGDPRRSRLRAGRRACPARLRGIASARRLGIGLDPPDDAFQHVAGPAASGAARASRGRARTADPVERPLERRLDRLRVAEAEARWRRSDRSARLPA